jgi:hypothetical protein
VIKEVVLMNFARLATDITVFLAPFFPYLISGGEEAVKEIGKKFGEIAWKKAQALWSKIRNPNLEGVAMALAEDPNDEDFLVALAKLLTKHLEASPELAAELMSTMKEDKAVQKVLIGQGSKAKDIIQRLSKTGKQETIVRKESQVGSITQEQ